MAQSPVAGDQRLTAPSNAALIVTAASGHAVVHWFGQAFPVLLAELVTTLGLTPFSAGLIVASRSLVGALANIPMGIAADRWASKRAWFLALALVWFGAAYYLIGTATTLTMLVIFAGVMGVGAALWHPPAIGMLSTRFPERRAFVMSLHGIGASVGDIVGPLLIGVLLGLASYQTIFRGAFLPALALGVALFIILSRMGAGRVRGHSSLGDYFRAVRVAASHRALMTSILAGGMRSGGQITLMAFVPLYARETLGFEPQVVGVLAALLLGMSLISQPLLGYYSDRIGRKTIVIPGLVILSVATPFIGLATTPLVLLPLVGLIGLFLFSSGLLINALGLDIAPPELASSTTAAQFLTGLTVGTAAPLMAGAAGNTWGLPAAFHVATGFFVVTLLMVLTLPKAERRGSTPRFAAS